MTAWANLPRYFWCAAAERPAPGATVLAWNPIPTAVRQAAADRPPLRRQGPGAVRRHRLDLPWRQNVGDRFFYKFWGQGVRFVARRDPAGAKKSWLEVSPLRASPGEPAQVELMAFAADGSPRTEPR